MRYEDHCRGRNLVRDCKILRPVLRVRRSRLDHLRPDREVRKKGSYIPLNANDFGLRLDADLMLNTVNTEAGARVSYDLTKSWSHVDLFDMSYHERRVLRQNGRPHPLGFEGWSPMHKEAGCWILRLILDASGLDVDPGGCILDPGGWMLDLGGWMLDLGGWMLDLEAGCWTSEAV
jgi:hypothetical protein